MHEKEVPPMWKPDDTGIKNFIVKKGACMKITISSQGKTLESAVDPRFGRAAQFIIYDTETAQYEVVSNSQGLNAAQGAGIKAAEAISRQGAQVLITGHCGPKAFETLAAAGIKIFLGAEGITVSQALNKFNSGQLKESGSSDVSGHWK
jgi:predicted Fe-Mo cluster-binding NifX family protein